MYPHYSGLYGVLFIFYFFLFSLHRMFCLLQPSIAQCIINLKVRKKKKPNKTPHQPSCPKHETSKSERLFYYLILFSLTSGHPWWKIQVGEFVLWVLSLECQEKSRSANVFCKWQKCHSVNGKIVNIFSFARSVHEVSVATTQLCFLV